MSQKFKSDIEVQAGLRDSSGSLGASGQVLSTTGTGVAWINENQVAHTISNQVKAGVAINKGQAVYATGADGTNIIVGLASNATEATSSKTLGLLDATVSANGFANVVENGKLDGLNTLGAVAGDPVWLGVNGNLIYGLANKPYAPANLVFIGIVTRVNANNGEIFVNVQNGFELNEIHDVDLKTNVPVNGDVLGFNGTLWVNKTIAQWLGYTPANANGTTNYVSKFTGSTTLGNSQIFDNGTNVGIGDSNPGYKLTVIGSGYFNDNVLIGNGSQLRFTVPGINIKPELVNSTWSDLSFSTNNSEKMRITSSGNVGIGTTSPSARLDVVANTPNDGTRIRITNTSDTIYSNSSLQLFSHDGSSASAGTFLFSTSNNFTYGTISPNQTNLYGVRSGGVRIVTGVAPIVFGNGANDIDFAIERMRITSSGNVGIGTTTPQSPLQVGNYTFSGGYARGTVATFAGAWSSILPTLTLISTDTTSTQNKGGGIAFAGGSEAGSTPYTFAQIKGLKELTGGTYSGYMAFYTTPAGSDANTERMRITSSGNVGIGTTNPVARLHVNGDALINSVTVGRGGGNITTNTVVGNGAFQFNTSGINNTAIGVVAMADNTLGNYNVAIGSGALSSNYEGNFNIAVGFNANCETSNLIGTTVIGTELNTNTNLQPLENNCLAISQFNSNTPNLQVPHIYAPATINIGAESEVDVITFDVEHYVGAIVEYLVRLNDGSDYAMGTVYMAWKSSGNGGYRDVRQIEWANMSGFTFSLSGAGTTLTLSNSSVNAAWVRITARGFMVA